MLFKISSSYMRVAFPCRETMSFMLQFRGVAMHNLLLSLIWHFFLFQAPKNAFIFWSIFEALWGRNHVCVCLYSRSGSCCMTVVCKHYHNINSTLIINYIVNTLLCLKWWHWLWLFGSSQRCGQDISIIKTFVWSHGCPTSSWNRFRNRDWHCIVNFRCLR